MSAPVDPGQTSPNALLRLSFADAMRNPEHFGRCFYERLFQLAPQVRSLFPTDTSLQQQKLVQALAVLIRGLDQPEALVPVLRHLGARHFAYGTRPAHFAVVGEALIETMDRLATHPLDNATRAAWNMLYGWVAVTMREGVTAAMDEPDAGWRHAAA
jgi:hemoglobin-like flavoprotein